MRLTKHETRAMRLYDMQLYLDSYGAFLKVRNKMFDVKLQYGATEQFATTDVEVIILTQGVMLTTDAMLLALENDIPIIIIDFIGHPVGQVWSGKFGSIASIRRNQIFFSEHSDGLTWTAQNLSKKIESQRTVLQNTFEQNLEIFDGNATSRHFRALSTLDNLSKKFQRWKHDGETRNAVLSEFRAWEATASRTYFRFLASIMTNEKWQFENRNFHPAQDRFNCLLNYLYGMLYTQVELALVKVGIDPALGIMHVDRHNRPTMSYDFIEPYRHWADTIAIELALKDLIPSEGFILSDPFANKPDEDVGYWLDTSAKPIVVERFLSFMNEKVIHKKVQQRRLSVLELDAQTFATVLKKFKPE